jgi:hypothetical protein
MPTASRNPWLRGSAALLLSVLPAALPAFAQDSEVEEPEGVLWSTAPDTPFAFWRFDAAWSRETKKVYFLGGRLADGTTDGSVWSYDPLTGTYADTLVDMPTPVSNYHIAALRDAAGDEVLVTFGGRPAVVPPNAISVVQGFYPIDNSITTFTSDPYPVAMNPGGVAVVRNKAYVFGGFDATTTTAATFIFDPLAPSGSRWTTGPSLNLSRGFLASAVIDGYVYAIGGDTFATPNLHASQVVERLNTANPVGWDDVGVADLPPVGAGPDFGCDENRAEGFDNDSLFAPGRLILAGCGQWPAEVPDSHIYSAAGNAWDTNFPDLNLDRRNHGGAVIPMAGLTAIRPAFWVWGGRFDADATLRTTPEYYTLTVAQLLFADDFDYGDLISWDADVP